VNAADTSSRERQKEQKTETEEQKTKRLNIRGKSPKRGRAAETDRTKSVEERDSRYGRIPVQRRNNFQHVEMDRSRRGR